MLVMLEESVDGHGNYIERYAGKAFYLILRIEFTGFR